MNKIRVLQHYLKTRYRQSFTSRQELERHQRQQLDRFFLKLPSNLAYFTGLSQLERNQLSIDTLDTLPITDKLFMMKNFDKINTVGIAKKQAFDVALKAEESRDFSPMLNGVTIGLSSGTSGNRGLFLVSPEERERWAGIMLAKMLPKSIIRKQKVAFFLRANSNLYETVSSSTIQFTFYDLLDPVNENVNKLRALSPDIVIAPPSMLRIIADLKDRPPFKRVISVAEVLEKKDQAYLAQAFDQTIHQIYQCTEGFLAHTCKEGNLHLNEEFVYIEKEYIDEEKGIFSPIITDFSRMAQPIIRYRLNDLLVEKDELCRCGSACTVLDRIDGRSDDIFIFEGADSGEEVAMFPDFIRRTLILHGDERDQFRVIQEKDGTLAIYVTNVQDGDAIKRSFLALFSKMACVPVDLTIFPYIPPEAGVKLRRVQKR